MRTFLIFLLLLAAAVPGYALEIKTDSGKVYSGDVLDEDAGYYYLDTTEGIINISKQNILQIDGKDYAAPKTEMQERYATGIQTEVEAGGLGLEGPLAAKVGAGGVTEKEFYWYLVRAGYRDIKTPADVAPAERSRVLEDAVNDEIIFQEALSHQVHASPLIKKHIAESYKNDFAIAGVEPASMQTDEIKEYYQKNLKKFMSPAQYQFKVLNVNNQKETLEKAKRSPQSVNGWKSTGWMDKGGNFYLPLPDSVTQQIFSMRQNEVRDFKDSMGGQYVFWLTDYKPEKQIPLEQAREKIKHEMIKSQMASNTKAFDSQFKKDAGKTPTIDELFKKGLEAGKHRERMTRENIINTYVQQTGGSRDALLEKLKPAYSIEIPEQ